ncbi:TetR/AcrR family transcriptional regulator [Streptomyces paludis]|uniref:TetR/AcrR family transcriptional regulator n=2 Tax=Streptomyces paludis TaxID=2282738 RepID=A0A345HRE4_9ACTN|nr:TetR/AcrR family transcriptional regulator [Streptomyces paludis]
MASARRDEITEAAAGVFLRYGFKKASMDDLARAARISRQGLYLHFRTKDALFEAVLVQLVAQLRAAAVAAIDRDDLEPEDRLVGAFEAFCGYAVSSVASESFNELMETATSVGGPLVREAETEFVRGIAGLLTRTGVAETWAPAGIPPEELANHLYATSSGLKHLRTPPEEYRARMRTAVRIVRAGGPGAGSGLGSGSAA